MAIAINATQNDFFQTFVSLFNEFNATVQSDFEGLQNALSNDLDRVALTINSTQERFFQAYGQLFEELNATLRSDFQRSETALQDTIYSNLLQATHNVLERVVDIEEFIAIQRIDGDA